MKSLNIARTREFEQLQSFCRPLSDHFGISYFWHYTISKSGTYTFIGTHLKWLEYCFENNILKDFSMLRHPDLVDEGITFMKHCQDPHYQEMLRIAQEKFALSFNINIVEKTNRGVEAFGFASEISDTMQDQRIINELPLFRYFIKSFKEKHVKLLEKTQDEEINLIEYLGEKFYQRPSTIFVPSNREAFLRKIGLSWILCLTPRERDILALLPTCILCQEIAHRLSLSTRTVENYVATLKCKLHCKTKAELIQKAHIFIEVEQVG